MSTDLVQANPFAARINSFPCPLRGKPVAAMSFRCHRLTLFLSFRCALPVALLLARCFAMYAALYKTKASRRRHAPARRQYRFAAPAHAAAAPFAAPPAGQTAKGAVRKIVHAETRNRGATSRASTASGRRIPAISGTNPWRAQRAEKNRCSGHNPGDRAAQRPPRLRGSACQDFGSIMRNGPDFSGQFCASARIFTHLPPCYTPRHVRTIHRPVYVARAQGAL